MAGVLMHFKGKAKLLDPTRRILTVRDVDDFFDDRREVECYFTPAHNMAVLEAVNAGAKCELIGEWFNECQKFLLADIRIISLPKNQKPSSKKTSTLDYTKM